jgi:hypothetical protein
MSYCPHKPQGFSRLHGHDMWRFWPQVWPNEKAAKRTADDLMIQLFVMRKSNQLDSREIIDAVAGKPERQG